MNILKTIFSEQLLNRKRGRQIKVFDDDVFIVSYPKSGNTWMRFLIGNLLYEDFSFSNMEKKIPDIYINTNKELFNISRPRILKSHEYFDYKYKKVIYIIRDPRSVAVSYYFYQKKMKKIPDSMAFKDFLKDFLDGKVDSYASWADNVLSWICTKEFDSSGFLLLKYEEIKKDPHASLLQIISFLSLSVTENQINNALIKSSMKNMKKNELENKGKIKGLENSDQNKSFVREGRIDEWKDYFDENDISLLLERFGNAMKKVGYKC